MKRFTMFACLAMTLVIAMNAFALELDKFQLPEHNTGDIGIIYGSSTDMAKAAGDTVVLIGPYLSQENDPNFNGTGHDLAIVGTFQESSGAPSWNGWTTQDITLPTVTHWHASNYQADGLAGHSGAENMAMYCGDETYPACAAPDIEGGYGSNWVEIVHYTATIDDNTAPTDVDIDFFLNNMTEPGYDKAYLILEKEAGLEVLVTWDGLYTNINVALTGHYIEGDYFGENNDQIRVMIQFLSDTNTDDSDCQYPSTGAMQIDDMEISGNNGLVTYLETFQGVNDEGSLGQWVPDFPTGVGDFSQLWSGLEDDDPCNVNYTPQVAFIDDGLIVPGVGPSLGDTWDYGPQGHVVNYTGGATFSDDNHVHIAVLSPVLNWPGEEYVGGQVLFDVYLHENLEVGITTGVLYQHGVRSAVDPADLEFAPWAAGFWTYGGPAYSRGGGSVSADLEPGLTVTQIQLNVWEIGWAWGYEGTQGTPAPYFDNVRYIAYKKTGPSMSTISINLAQDNFPEIGVLDYSDLGMNDVRFDMARNIDLQAQATNTPGDSITVTVVSNRADAVLALPLMHYKVKLNPLFDPYRSLPAGGTTVDGVFEHFVEGYKAVNVNGFEVPDSYAFDLPDEDFLYPGDIVHYYFTAEDDLDGVVETSQMPGNLDGYGDFVTPLAYSSDFQVACLPSMTAATVDDQPSILFWNDFENRGGENEWYGALNNLGLVKGVHYDVYYTNGASSTVGNGLGGRASIDQIMGYTTMLYTSGTFSSGTLEIFDPAGGISNDIGLLDQRFLAGGFKAFLTGDDLITDLVRTPEGNAFRTAYLGVSLESSNLMPLINFQTTPLVVADAENVVFTNTTSWIAYGGCNSINTFDAVVPLAGAFKLASFVSPTGDADAYDHAGAILYENPGFTSVAISLPYDFMEVFTNPDDALTLNDGPVPTRVVMLDEVLGYFGHSIVGGVIVDVPDAGKFFAKNYPNPFNPTTKIEFNMPKAGHLSLKVYNVRGELVKSLIDETRAVGADHIMWDGTNDQGSNVSSGVYFYEARTAGNVVVNKMALVK